jgi:hypothetical protein
MLFSFIFAGLAALAPLVSASPVRNRRSQVVDLSLQSPVPAPVFGNGLSFNNFGGSSRLNGFDQFLGAGNFYGGFNQVIVVQEQIVCDAVDIIVIQQKLAVILEVAKQFLIEEVCDVQAQIIIFQQFFGRAQDFGRGLRQRAGGPPGYDKAVAGLIGNIVGQDGSRQRNNLGFNGWDIGKQQVRLGRGLDGWDNQSSPAQARAALEAARRAHQDKQNKQNKQKKR